MTSKQAIPTWACTTKFHGPTPTKGPRVSATHVTTKQKVTLPWDAGLHASENHEAAARTLRANSPQLQSYELPLTAKGRAAREPMLSAAVDGGGWIFMVGRAVK